MLKYHTTPVQKLVWIVSHVQICVSSLASFIPAIFFKSNKVKHFSHSGANTVAIVNLHFTSTEISCQVSQKFMADKQIIPA